uniref:Uncharacterized protein n=1 Tax=Panagrolaimus sp. PS1159 TaxID=55785 RepID=A0AC35GGG9_9BILA
MRTCKLQTMNKQLLLAYFSFLVLASANCPVPSSQKEKLQELMKKRMIQAFNAMRQNEAAKMATTYARKKSEIRA